MAYISIHTSYGLMRMAAAEASGVPINLTHMAVGDGNGNEVFPTEAQTILVGVPVKIVRVLLKTAAGTDDTSPRYLHSRGVRFRVSGYGVSGQWALVALEIAYQILKGLRRSFRQ